MNKLIASLAALVTAAGISCAGKPMMVPLNAAGDPPKVEYFFSPSCEYCEKTDRIADLIERRFTGQLNLERYCVITNAVAGDVMTCSELYSQNAWANGSKLESYGSNGVPEFFVDGEMVKTPAEICDRLGQEPDCLDE